MYKEPKLILLHPGNEYYISTTTKIIKEQGTAKDKNKFQRKGIGGKDIT